MAEAKKPNILILWGDDIGWWNISFNSRGQMGYRTPNIDRIANEGVAFTDYYGQQSCTAGRAAFITGQNPIRTGLTKVGMPGADVGLSAEDPTIAELLKPLGYMTGQFGKNHLGDKDKFLPTMHGFDEFFGNLYHLNAEEEPEDPDYPTGPRIQEAFRAARRHALLGRRQGRPESRGHRSPQQEADGDDRRRGDRARAASSSTSSTRPTSRSSSGTIRPACTSAPIRRPGTRARATARAICASLPKPKAIVIVSAHWEDAPLSISATGAHTPLVYDFWGFPQRYYEVAYPTPDASELARGIVASMPDGLHLHQHPVRGLDHGAYVPLQVMYPLADIPVIQMSMPTQDPAQLFAIGARLRALRAEGVLVIGSGFLTHHGSMSAGQADLMPYNADFDAWAADALDRGAIDELFAWTDRAPAARLAHPTPDHFIPLFVTLGAADNPATTVQTTITGGLFGNSKRSFQVV